MCSAKKQKDARSLNSREIQEWVDLNLEINSTSVSKAWIDEAFAACERLGIRDVPSLAHTLIVSSDDHQGVGGVIVSSKTRVLACFSVAPDSSFELDEEQTRVFQTILPDHVVAILLASYASRKTSIN
jgi:hypothetical protein